MPPKLRVLAENPKFEQRMKSDISQSLASILKKQPQLTPKEALWSVQAQMLSNNPYEPPKNGKCAINELPNEILGHIFAVGVREQEDEEWDHDSEDEGIIEEDEWEDMDEDEDGDEDEGEEGVRSRVGKKEAAALKSALSDDSFMSDDSDEMPVSDGEDSDSDSSDDPILPFQVLVSHVCKRWREVSLDSHALWTTLNFTKTPRIEKARVYIERAQGLPLNICIDCTFPGDTDEEDHPDHPLYGENQALHSEMHRNGACEDPECPEELDEEFLSQKDLKLILELLEPEVGHWRVLDFRASTYGYVQLLLSRLHELPSAPVLESFQLYHFEECEDYEFFSGDDKTSYLPFHGDAPMLKDAAFWGVHIDWDNSLTLLRGLHDLELSYHAKDVRPSYATFAQIIKNSPELHTLTLSLSGPALADDTPFDDEKAWGPVPLEIPSLKELGLQFHTPQYASALVQHLALPNVTSLALNFDEEDYSSFVHWLLQPVKDRTKSLLAGIEHLKISGLPCDVPSVEAMLDQLAGLKSFNLKCFGEEEAVFFDKLINPSAGRPSLTSPHPPFATPYLKALPKLFCPLLESMTTVSVTGAQVKLLVQTRKTLGAPIKKVFMSQDDPLTAKEERWLVKNLEVLDFFEPSDSEDEFDIEDVDIGEDDDISVSTQVKSKVRGYMYTDTDVLQGR
ncbi:hypothetical protein B0H34DRAFT_789290 [Crassisporium funariophilum]|nr:hypothetical protein B0H34DRAFT_789290 [Crassisporium funariophilum]